LVHNHTQELKARIDEFSRKEQKLNEDMENLRGLKDRTIKELNIRIENERNKYETHINELTL